VNASSKEAKAFGWYEARKKTAEQKADSHLRRGVGWPLHYGSLEAEDLLRPSFIKLFSDGSVSLNMAQVI